MPRNALTDPRTPDCFISGCANVAYKKGVCRRHWRELPLELRMGFMLDHWRAGMEASRQNAEKVREHYATASE